MTNDEAKFILSAYRPGGRAEADPAMAQALEQAKRDPALRAWFERQQAHDTVLAAKLRELAPPAGLREAILAGARLSQPAEIKTKAGGAAARAWWRRPLWLAAAAAIALLAGVMAWRFSPVRGETMEEFAVNFVQRGFVLQKHGADVGALKDWLGAQHGPLPEALPAQFADLHALGCRTLDYRGHEVSLVCFERGGKEYHVFVARRDDVPGWDPKPRFLENRAFAAVTWTDDKNRYVLVSDAGMAAVRELL